MLRSERHGLEDLANEGAEIFDADAGVSTGLRLHRHLGAGGMSSVFEALVVHRSPLLHPSTPGRVAVKILLPETARGLRTSGITNPLDFVKREIVGLERIASGNPPSPFVVSFYGSGELTVSQARVEYRLPWLALECVDLLPQFGATLQDRMNANREAMDPIRIARLADGMAEGISALHAVQVIHRDIKPENVLVIGPPGDETPKLSDCGIARVKGLPTLGAAGTAGYAAIEQLMALDLDKANGSPLVGPWTDVHAFAATLWQMIAGEPWARSVQAFMRGERRSLRSLLTRREGHRIHEAFTADPADFDELEALLAAGAAPLPPESLLHEAESAKAYERLRGMIDSAAAGAKRFRSIESFMEKLLPILQRAEDRAVSLATQARRPMTVLRPTVLMTPSQIGTLQYRARELTMLPPKGAELPLDIELRAGALAYRGDGAILAVSGQHVVFFLENRPQLVASPEDDAFDASAIHTAINVGTLGIVFADRENLFLFRSNSWTKMPRPRRESGAVGRIETCFAAADGLCVVTAETDDSGGFEIWKTRNGSEWTGPVVAPANADRIRAASAGTLGYSLVGAKGARARATYVTYDGHENNYHQVATGQPFECVVSGDREAWAAGSHGVVRLDDASVSLELADLAGRAPVALGLDHNGTPWLATTHDVYRREATLTTNTWRRVLERPSNSAPLVALGFIAEVVHTIDAAGTRILLEAHR